MCAECGIKKAKLSELKQHLLQHNDLRPFVCYICSISFKTKGNLSKHVKTKAHLNRLSGHTTQAIFVIGLISLAPKN